MADNTKQIVTVKDLADEMGLTKYGARAYVKRHNGQVFLMADPKRGGQKVLCMTETEANRIRRIRAETTL